MGRKEFITINLQDTTGDVAVGEYDPRVNKIAYYRGKFVSPAVNQVLISLAQQRWQAEKSNRHTPVLFTFNYVDDVLPLVKG